MNRKYDAAASRSELHQNRLRQLANRFESLEEQLGQLEAKIESQLPKLGIAVSPLGNRRKTIEPLNQSLSNEQSSDQSNEQRQAGVNPSGEIQRIDLPPVDTAGLVKRKPR